VSNGTLKFSVVLEAVTQAFNSAINQSKSAYSSATASIRKDSADLGAATGAAASKTRAIYGSLNIKPGSALRDEIAAITRQLSQFRSSTGNPAAEVERVTAAARARISELRNELNGITPSANSAASGVKSVFSSVLGVAGIAGGLAGVAAGLKAIVDTTIKFEAINKQLEFAVGSAARAGEEFEFVRRTATSLGLDLISAAEGYAKLAAATKGTALEGKATRDVFLGVSQAAATMGLSAAESNGVFLALAQIAGKGKVSMEELRGQLGERLPLAMKIAADSMGVTVERLNKLVEAGLDSNEFLAAFGPALQKAFAADAAKNAATLQGRINLLKNEFKLLLKELGDSGVGKGVASVFNDLGGAVTKIRDTLKTLDPKTVDTVHAAFQQLYGTTKEVFSTLFSAVNDVNTVLETLTSLVTGTVNAFTGLSGAEEQVSFLTRVLQGVSVILGSIADGVYTIRIAFTAATGVVQEFFGQIALGLSKVTFGEVSKELEELAKRLGKAGEESLGNAGKLADDFKSQTVAAMDRAVQASQDAALKSSAAHVAGAAKSAAAQAGIASAATAAGAQLAASAQNSVKELQYIGDKAAAVAKAVTISGGQATRGIELVGEAATLAKQKIDVFAGVGGGALVNMANAVNETKKAFSDLAKDVGVQLPAVAETTTQLGLALATVAAKNKEVAASIAKELPEAISKLNSADLKEFQTSFIGGLERAGASADYVKARVLDFATAATKALGSDITASLTVLSTKFKENEKSLLDLSANFDKLKNAGVDASKALGDSLTAMLAKASNPVEVEELIKLWQQLGSEGKISGKAMVDGLTAAKAKLDELKPGINSLAEAFKTFGLTTKEESAKLADTYKVAFDKISASGQATTAQLQQAFQTYADAAIAANGGVVSEFLRAEAEARGLQIRVDETGRAIVEAMGTATASTRELADGFKKVGDAAVSASERANAALERQISAQEKSIDLAKRQTDLENKRKGVDSQGFSTDSNGNRITISSETKESVFRTAKGQGLSDEQATALSNQFIGNRGEPTGFGSVDASRGENWGTALWKAIEEMLRENRRKAADEERKAKELANNPVAKSAEKYLSSVSSEAAAEVRVNPPGAPRATSRAAASVGVADGRTVNINFTLGGQTVRSSIAASDETALLSILQRAKGVSS
jgi:tape measure domain-containing protein